MDFEDWQCPAGFAPAISWLCTVCGRGRTARLPAAEQAPEGTAED